MRTRNEIEALKLNWMYDPIWDIEETAGFEEYKDELLAFRKQKEVDWAAEFHNKLVAKADDLGVPGNLKLAKYVLDLEKRLEEMNKTLENVYFR